jgi:hypothetical protein
VFVCKRKEEDRPLVVGAALLVLGVAAWV